MVEWSVTIKTVYSFVVLKIKKKIIFTWTGPAPFESRLECSRFLAEPFVM